MINNKMSIEEKKHLCPTMPLPEIEIPEMILSNTFGEHLDAMEVSIKKFESEEIEKGKILFYGHSHFTRWGNCQKPNYCKKLLVDSVTTPMGKKPCINHGFGSSTIYDLCYFYERAVRPWEPKAIVISTYANCWSFRNEDKVKLADWLATQIAIDFPECKIFFTDYPPYAKMNGWKQETRESVRKLVDEVNAAVLKNKNAKIIEMTKYHEFYQSPEFVGKYEGIRPELFCQDGVHHSPEGYDVCEMIYKKELKEILEEYDRGE